MKLTEDVKAKIREFYEIVSNELPGFKKRVGQRQMIACASSAMGNAKDAGEETTGANFAVIEGKTGVGKTVGYLVPALVMATEMNKKLIISSATVSLQEQLIDRDIPTIVNLYPKKSEISVVLAKGRNRYACTTKLQRITNTSSSADMIGGAIWDRPPRQDEVESLYRMANKLNEDWSGDRDELPFSVSDEVWSKVTNDSHGCPGVKCQDYKICPFIKSRQRLRSANVIVANHDFMLSSLAVESKSLPPPHETIMVFDEAHHLPEIAVRRFASSHTLGGSISWLEKLLNINDKAVEVIGDKEKAALLGSSASQLVAYLKDLKSALDHSSIFDKTQIYRYPHGLLDQSMEEMATSILGVAETAYGAVQSILDSIDAAREAGTASDDVLNKFQSDIGFMAGRMENLLSTWQLFAKSSSNPPLAKWIEVVKEDYMIAASPLSAADMLNATLWEGASSIVLTSATITTLGSFDYYLERTGLINYPDTMTLAVKSPFNYAEQGKIYLPRLHSNPKDQDAHAQEMISVLPEMLKEHRGSLVLFASKKMMNTVYEALVAQGQADEIIVQAQYPKREIIRMHTERINSGMHSAIFGLASFGEGVDLPGALCEQVIITKIPFAPPDTPTEMAMQEWIESMGGNPFNEVSLPKAGLMLTQWVGRLIRSEEDRGRVVFLDSRMVTAKYKGRIIAGLPEFTIVRE